MLERSCRTGGMAMKTLARGTLLSFCILVSGSLVFAQDSKSAALAKQLATALDAAKLDSVAAKHPGKPDVFVGALYFPGFQLLTISATYSAPTLLDARLDKKEYREAYIDLN